jgi:hypothetical protein
LPTGGAAAQRVCIHPAGCDVVVEAAAEKLEPANPTLSLHAWRRTRQAIRSTEKAHFMKTFQTAMIPTLLLLAGSALAQGQMNQADVQRRSTEMMIPPGIAATVLSEPAARATPAAQSPTSDADRRTREMNSNTDMMRPQSLNSRAPTGAAAAAPVAEDDRRMAEIIKRTDQMKPN